jgi:hypothetical protein
MNTQKKQLNNKILCQHILFNNKCIYINNCNYAHSLKEQQIEINRNNAIQLLKNDNLENINIINNSELIYNLMVLCKLCKNCINNKCTGGYNCKFGACNTDILICKKDFLYGNCPHINCTFGNHLTTKKFTPLKIQQNNSDSNNFIKYKIHNKIGGQRILNDILFIEYDKLNNYYDNNNNDNNYKHDNIIDIDEL